LARREEGKFVEPPDQLGRPGRSLGGTTRTIGYDYDGLGRLTAADDSLGNTFGYGYDRAEHHALLRHAEPPDGPGDRDPQ
jgi:YD repeat-containing protein